MQQSWSDWWFSFNSDLNSDLWVAINHMLCEGRIGQRNSIWISPKRNLISACCWDFFVSRWFCVFFSCRSDSKKLCFNTAVWSYTIPLFLKNASIDTKQKGANSWWINFVMWINFMIESWSTLCAGSLCLEALHISLLIIWKGLVIPLPSFFWQINILLCSDLTYACKSLVCWSGKRISLFL